MIIVKTDGEISGLSEVAKKLASLPDGMYFVDIRESKKSRSLQQNRYYWGVVIDILSRDTGYYPEEIHQLMAKKFLSYEKKGEVFVKSTTMLSTTEFEEYLSKIRIFASMELGIFIPLPNEVGYDI